MPRINSTTGGSQGKVCTFVTRPFTSWSRVSLYLDQLGLITDPVHVRQLPLLEPQVRVLLQGRHDPLMKLGKGRRMTLQGGTRKGGKS